MVELAGSQVPTAAVEAYLLAETGLNASSMGAGRILPCIVFHSDRPALNSNAKSDDHFALSLSPRHMDSLSVPFRAASEEAGKSLGNARLSFPPF